MKWVVASDHDQPNCPLSQEIATNGARGMNWLQDWVHDFDALSALYWLSAAFSDSHYGSSRDDCSTRASNCREVWASSKCAGYRLSTLNLVMEWSPHCWQRSSGQILLAKGEFLGASGGFPPDEATWGLSTSPSLSFFIGGRSFKRRIYPWFSITTGPIDQQIKTLNIN